MSRRAFQPTPEQRRTVRTMAAYGIRHEEIAKVVGCDEKTLRKHFRDELDKAMLEANAKVAETMFRLATRGTPQTQASTIFWCKARMGWSERSQLDVGNPDGQPFAMKISPLDAKCL
jgi:AraC-like DNA-binding protein